MYVYTVNKSFKIFHAVLANETKHEKKTGGEHLGVFHELPHKQRLILMRGEVLQNVNFLRLDVGGVTVAAEELCVVVAEAVWRLLHEQGDVGQPHERHLWVGVPRERKEGLLHPLQRLRVPAQALAAPVCGANHKSGVGSSKPLFLASTAGFPPGFGCKVPV
jgi:hypothetical protein